MNVHGLPLSDVAHRVGSLAQVARIDRFVEDDGAARGARRFRVVTGGGLEVDLHPDRALDVGQVTLDGIPVAWMSAGGIKHPAFYDPHGAGWLRTFGGGLLTTCGLNTFGAPSVDGGVAFGQHGRLSSTPAEIITTSSESGRLVVEGVMRQSAHFGENLVLRRRFQSDIGSSELVLEDVVTNHSSAPSPHMIMYHANLGWPLVERGATFDVSSSAVEARDPRSQQQITEWRTFEDPEPVSHDLVYLHSFDDEGPSAVTCTLTNPRIGVRLDLEYDRRQLPWLCQWKMMTQDAYVLGIEPVNTPTMVGRADARGRGVLPHLRPGESAHYRLVFRFSRC